MVDIQGLVYHRRNEEMFPEKEDLARGMPLPPSQKDSWLARTFLSNYQQPTSSGPDMLKKMASDPIVFAMANPDPEIPYDLARTARPDAIVATGRSDCPNQINNVLGFPYLLGSIGCPFPLDQ